MKKNNISDMSLDDKTPRWTSTAKLSIGVMSDTTQSPTGGRQTGSIYNNGVQCIQISILFQALDQFGNVMTGGQFTLDPVHGLPPSEQMCLDIISTDSSHYSLPFTNQAPTLQSRCNITLSPLSYTQDPSGIINAPPVGRNGYDHSTFTFQAHYYMYASTCAAAMKSLLYNVRIGPDHLISNDIICIDIIEAKNLTSEDVAVKVGKFISNDKYKSPRAYGNIYLFLNDNALRIISASMSMENKSIGIQPYDSINNKCNSAKDLNDNEISGVVWLPCRTPYGAGSYLGVSLLSIPSIDLQTTSYTVTPFCNSSFQSKNEMLGAVCINFCDTYAWIYNANGSFCGNPNIPVSRDCVIDIIDNMGNTGIINIHDFISYIPSYWYQFCPSEYEYGE